jgi:hypothetical protein
MVSTVPRSLDRHSVESIQDALVDLQLLRATQMVVGTTDSSTSPTSRFRGHGHGSCAIGRGVAGSAGAVERRRDRRARRVVVAVAP